MRKLCTREKYLEIKEDTYELPYSILTLLLGKLKSVELIKEKNRDEGKFKTFNKIISLAVSAASLSISRSKIFFIS